MKTKEKSKMTSTLTGIIHVTGEPDVGKTTFALECGAEPARTLFLDDDVKGKSTVAQLVSDGYQFGRYVDMTDLRRGKGERAWLRTVREEVLDQIKPEQFDALVWDTWTATSQSLIGYVRDNPKEFRDGYAPMGSIKGGQEWQDAGRLEAELLNDVNRLIPTIILITHLKDEIISNARTGRKIPASSRTLARIARMRLWLRHNPSGPVPIALVLKRIDRKIVTESGVRTVSVLPRKIVPQADEASLWDSIRRYMDEPVGLRELTSAEAPDAFELSMLDGTLTPEQRQTFNLMLAAGAASQEEEAETTLGSQEEQIAARAREMTGSPVQIAKMLSGEFGVQIGPGLVVGWRR